MTDKEFSFCLRDRLAKYCDDNDIILSVIHQRARKDMMLLDMIVYSSMGDEEQGLENLKETYNFILAARRQSRGARAEDLMWSFWKSCFIRVKRALASGQQEQIEACKDFARYPKGYTAHVQNFVGSQLQLNIYYMEQTTIWANDSQEVNNSLNR